MGEKRGRFTLPTVAKRYAYLVTYWTLMGGMWHPGNSYRWRDEPISHPEDLNDLQEVMEAELKAEGWEIQFLVIHGFQRFEGTGST